MDSFRSLRGERHKSESESFGGFQELPTAKGYGYGLVALNTYTCKTGPRWVVLPQHRLNPLETRRFAMLICQGYGGVRVRNRGRQWSAAFFSIEYGRTRDLISELFQGDPRWTFKRA